MLSRTTRVGLVTLATLVAALALTTTAATAAPGTGAIVVDVNECTTTDFGTTCVDRHIVFQSTATPSGNFINTINQDMKMSFTGSGFLAGCNTSQDVKAHQHQLQQEIETQEFHVFNKGEFSFTCFGFSLTCTFETHTHFAQGQFQPGRTEFNCS